MITAPRLRKLRELVDSAITLAENHDTYERLKVANFATPEGARHIDSMLNVLAQALPRRLDEIAEMLREMQDLEMPRCLVLSTAHISEDVMLKLSRLTSVDRVNAGWPAMTVAPYEYGVFLTVPEYAMRDYARMPEALSDVLAYAKRHGADVLRLDADGPTVADLKPYEW